MRILHVAPYYAPAYEWGGPARSVPELVEGLALSGHRVTVFTTGTRASAEYETIPEGVSTNGRVTVRVFAAKGPRRFFFSPTMAQALRREIRGFDIVHVTGMWTFAGCVASVVARQAGVPYVISPRGSLDPWALGQKRLKKGAYFWLFENRNLVCAAGVHFTTRAEAEKCGLLLKRIRPFVVGNAVPDFECSAIAHGSRKPNILCLGRIHPMKGFDVLIPAMRKVLLKVPSARLWIVGPSEDGFGDEVRRDVERAGMQAEVTFFGMKAKEDVHALLGETRILVSPSLRENFGMSVAEAMGHGVPVVISGQVDLAAAVEREGAGIVVERTPVALSEALVTLLNDPERGAAMGERGRAFVRRHLGPGAVAGRLAHAYELCSRGLGRGVLADIEGEREVR